MLEVAVTEYWWIGVWMGGLAIGLFIFACFGAFEDNGPAGGFALFFTFMWPLALPLALVSMPFAGVVVLGSQIHKRRKAKEAPSDA